MAKINRSLAIVIGIDKYKDIPKLKNAVSDADQLASVLKNIYGYEVLLLKDEEATKAEFDQLVTNLKKKTIQFDCQSRQVEPSDRVLFYFAGHGFAEEAQDREDGKPVGYFMPQNAESDNPNTWLSMHEIYEAFTDLGCHHLLMILDCCFAGRISWAEYRRNAARPRKLYKQSYEHFIKHPTQQIITSAAHDEKAQDSFRFGQRGDYNGHSPFAHLLSKVLQGNSDGGNDKFIEAILEDKVITVHELFTYIQNQLRQVAHGQTPALSQPRKYDQQTGKYVYFKGEYLFPLHNFKPDEDLIALKLDESKNPYKGLASFENQEEDIKLFFGRKRLIEESQEGLLAKVNSHPLTIVLGTSGSGKSSLVKAGLIPALKSAEEFGHQKWVICEPMRPGESPLNALNKILPEFRSLTSFKSSLKFQKQVKIIFNNIAKLINNNLESKLLLIIDQAEELFTLCKNQEERTDFINLLNVLLNNNKQQLRIVITLRSDFEPQLRDAIQETHWQNLWQDGRFFVTPMYREELQQAIEEPAAQRALFFESPKLVNDLIDEVIQMPGGLPLLSFTLSELYLKYLKAEENGDRNDRTITEADYKEIGGVTRSLTQTADKTYNKLIEEQVDEQTKKAYESTIRHVMLRMVAISGGELARRRVPITELEYPGAKNEQAKKVISNFKEARLLVSGIDVDNKPYIEPAHDALVNGWSKLQEWIEQEKENLVLQRRLVASTRDWSSQSCNQDSPLLWNQDIARIEQLQEIAKSDNCWLNELELRFFEASVKLRDQQEQEKLERILDANISSSQMLFSSNKRLDALVNLINIGNTLQEELNKYKYSRLRFLVMLGKIFNEIAEYNSLNAHEGIVSSISFSRKEDKIFASVGYEDGMIKFWKCDGSQIKSIDGKHNLNIVDLTYSSDGDMLASASKDGSVNLWKTRIIQEHEDNQQFISVEQYKTLGGHEGHEDDVYSVSFNEKHKIIASASSDKTVKLWSYEGNLVKSLPKHKGKVVCVSFSPNGKMIASGDDDGNIRIWKLDSEQFKEFKAHNDSISTLSFSPDSKTLVSCSDDKFIKVWDIKRKYIEEPIIKFNEHEEVFCATFSPDGRTIASANKDGTIFIRFTDGQLIKTLKGHRGFISKVRFSPDGKFLTSCGEDGTIKFWHCQSRFEGHNNDIWGIDFSTNGEILITASSDKTAILWKRNGDCLKILQHDNKVYDAKLSPDSRTAVTVTIDGVIRIWYDIQANDNEVLPEPISISGSTAKIVSFSPVNDIFLAAEEDGTIKVFDLKGKLLDQKPAHKGKLTKITFSRKGKIIASASTDKTVKFWELNDDKLFQILEPITDFEFQVYHVSFSNDNQTIATVNQSDDIFEIKLWDLSGKLIKTIKSNGENLIRDLKFSSNDNMIAIVTLRSIEFLNLDGTLLESIHIDDIEANKKEIFRAAFSPDWSAIAIYVAGNKDYENRIKFWNLNLSESLKEAYSYIGKYLPF